MATIETYTNDPAKTYTLTEFIDMQSQDEMTYVNYSILQLYDNIRFSLENILDYYQSELKSICLDITSFSRDQISKYKYFPDILAYDVYGSTQLDFIVIRCNGIIDPKEFDFSRNEILLPRSDVLKEFLSSVYNNNRDWLDLNRSEITDELNQ